MEKSAFGVDHEISKEYSYFRGGALSATKDAPKGKKSTAYRGAAKKTYKEMAGPAVGGGAAGAAAGAVVGSRYKKAKVGAALGGVFGAEGAAIGHLMRPKTQKKIYNAGMKEAKK